MKAPSSADRVPSHTPSDVNQRIVRQTEVAVDYYSRHPEEIDSRLEQLDQEWDVERVLETNAATLALTGTLLSLLNRRWILLPAVVTGFLLQHGIQGWCPPLPVLRRLGFRTPREIEAERYALKALRGDFEPVGDGDHHARRALEATGRF